MTQYGTNIWKEYRNSVIELEGNKCSVCGRGGNEVVLQVHHKKYINGLKPWEYATKDCITLCRGCHAAEHGIIQPKIGWEYQGDEDLGDLIGICENCGSSLRYVFYVYHKKWGTMEVGTHCCDSLTDTQIASNLVESQRRYDERKDRFIKSKRWIIENNEHKIKQNNFEIEINQVGLEFFIKIQELKSNKPYKTIESAKTKAFDVIESGELMEYFKNHNIKLTVQKKGRKKLDNKM
jgi:5-methylcytosine-specific restriction endonuclease McrA